MADAIDKAVVAHPKQSVYDRVALKWLMWRHGMPSEMADWLMRRGGDYGLAAEAREVAEWVVEECGGR